MVGIRCFWWNLAAATSAATCWLTFQSEAAVALTEREPTAVGRDALTSDPIVGPKGGDGSHTGNAYESRVIYGGKSEALSSRKSLEAPRGAEGIRRRLAAGRGSTSSGQDGSEVAVNWDKSSIDLDKHASTGACKRREYWRGNEPHISAVDVCGVRGLDVHRCVQQECGNTAAGEGNGVTDAGQAPAPPEDDTMGLSRLHSALPEERGYGNGQQVPPPPPPPPHDGMAESSNSPLLHDGRGGLSASAPGISKSHEVSAPELEHDPWAGYQVIAGADPVTSWEILREVRKIMLTLQMYTSTPRIVRALKTALLLYEYNLIFDYNNNETNTPTYELHDNDALCVCGGELPA